MTFHRVVIAVMVGVPHLALGSSVAMTEGLPAVSTSFGVLSGEHAYRLCMSKHVFVGEITRVASYWHPANHTSASIWSDASFSVQRDLSDSVPPTRVVVLPGGRVGDVGSHSTGMPELRVGARYLLGLSPIAADNAQPLDPAGVEVLMADRPVAADADLPSEAKLRAEFKRVCSEVDVSR